MNRITIDTKTYINKNKHTSAIRL